MNDEPGGVVLTDVRMPFARMVLVLIKVAIAAIPALFVASVVAAFGVAMTISMFTAAIAGG